MASITKVDTTRGVRYRVRYRTPTGRSRTETFPRKADAERFANGVETNKALSQFVDPQRGQVRLRAYAKQWLKGKTNVGPRTHQNLAGRLDNHILPHFGDHRIADIQPADVREWIGDLCAKDLAPATVKATYAVFRQLMATAEIDRVIARTPCIGIRLPRD